MAQDVSARQQKARDRRDELKRRLSVLQAEVDEVQEGLYFHRPAGQRRRKTIPAGARRPNARRLNDTTVKDAIVDLLREKKKPMHYKDIAQTLEEEGRYRTKSSNFLSTVAITILRDKRLKRHEPGVYGLKSRYQ
ncbi:MAG: HTH domain-containing protein [Gemmatimonadota bacterium]|jgi:hypothetical protein|nr:HTH domain-containing protein [Gemmatimonadota bacterium]MDP6528751.1 HTH domain-containing protein [Gemmatimonadota bacterium]MDP6803192.1 HTH domain-containing protein [Gemmatimonadota bacterium]MDP7031270.1 HTH domain-containing protein [Gemmatimonadota bacterium]